MPAMLLARLLLLGVHGTAGYRVSEGDYMAPEGDYMVPESLAQRRQLFRQLGVVGKTRPEAAECVAEVPRGALAVVMLSGTGEGKSTTTCVIARDPVLAHVAAEGKADSETSESCIHKASWFFPYDRSEPLYLVDTPGFGDTRGEKVIKENNEDIVKTLKRAGHADVILWVLNSGDPKMKESRQDAFRFVRSYFGRELYKHIVFVYTRFSWNKKKGRKYVRGEVREKALMETHHNTMAALLNQVEVEYWPGGMVDPGVNDTIMQLPCFAFDTYAMEPGEDDPDGKLTFDDPDIGDNYNDDDPDGFGGVFNPEAFPKGVTPNSASQLRGLKAKILEISHEPPLDLTNLRPYQDGCLAALKDTVTTDPREFGQHVTDCVEGQQYKLLKDKVAPYVSGLQDGPVFAAFSIVAYTRGRGTAGVPLKAEAMKELGVPGPDRENAEAFASYDAYVSCRDAGPGQPSAAALARSLSTCLGGVVATGRGLPALVEAMKQRFFGEAARKDFSAAYVERLVAEIRKLPERESAVVWKHMDFMSLLSRQVQFAIEGPSGDDLGVAKVTLTASATLVSIVNGSVYKQPVVRALEEKGWVQDVFLHGPDGAAITDDLGLQHEIAEIFAGEASPSVNLKARVAWVPGSPPKLLDHRLLGACLDRSDLPAAAALVRDHVTHPGMLIFTANPEQVMPNTAKHELVFSDVVALRDAEVEALRGDTKAERTRELILQSGVLKGVYLGQDLEPRSADLIQVTRVPDVKFIRSLKTLPDFELEPEWDVRSRSAETISHAKRKGGTPFPESVSGAGVANLWLGALSAAEKVASAMEETAQLGEGTGSETRSFHALRVYDHTLANLALGGTDFRLATAFVAGAARILHKDKARWPDEIESLFRAYGTHYCPAVDVGGVYMAEAKFDLKGWFTDAEAEQAVSVCLASASAGVGAEAGGSGGSQPCTAEQEPEGMWDKLTSFSRKPEMMRSTTITKSCIPKMDKCPASDPDFASELRARRGWAVTSRNLDKCVAVWDALSSAEYGAELLRAAGGPPAAPVEALLEVMAKVWHLRALKLPKLCERVMGGADAECKDSGLEAAPQSKISGLWSRVRGRAYEQLEFSRQCAARSWCHNLDGHGECKMKGGEMTCECKPTFSGGNCQTKLPKEDCVKYRDTWCTAHPIAWYQPGCETLWDKSWRYSDWDRCPTGLKGYHVCSKSYKCQPDTEGHDCCGALGDKERWSKWR